MRRVEITLDPFNHHVTWFISDDAHYEVIEELERQTDRGAAIIGAAFLEERLAEAIKSRLRPVQGTVEKLFEPNGPLVVFSARIDMAYLLGFFGERSHRDLHLIRKIRNTFAHTPAPVSFASQDIVDRCRELWLSQNVLKMGTSSGPSEPRQQYLRAVNILNSLIWSEMTSSITKDRGQIPEPHFLRW